MARQLTCQLDRVAPVLQQAKRCIPPDDENGEAREMPGHIAAIRAYVASQQGDARRSNISDKLSAQNRTQCVARARELNLL